MDRANRYKNWKCYYHNRSTRLYTWDKPAEFDAAWLETQDKNKLIKRSKRGDSIGDKGWNIMSDKETDTIYYYNDALDQVASPLSPRTAHDMRDPPSALVIRAARWKKVRFTMAALWQ